MNKKIILLLVIFLILTNFVEARIAIEENKDCSFLEVVSDINSVRKKIDDIVIIPDVDPFFGVLGSYISCWYNNNGSSGLKPLLIQNKGRLDSLQEKFIDNFFTNNSGSLLNLGEAINTPYKVTNILGISTDVSLELVQYVYSSTTAIMVIPTEIEDYQKSIIASPLASYLDIPILIFKNNSNKINDLCILLNVSKAIVIGNFSITLNNVNITRLATIDQIQDAVLTVIKDKFSQLNYITLTNPSDVIQPQIVKKNQSIFVDHISNVKIIFLGEEFDIIGFDTNEYDIFIPEGINRIQIYTNITHSIFNSTKNRVINPIIFLQLFDPRGNIVAYSSSLALEIGTSYLDTLVCNASGNYSLAVTIFNGIKGGYFSLRGISIVNTDFEVTITTLNLKRPHFPLIPKLSIIAPYLTSAHGGIIIADSKFELTDENYFDVAQGYGAGPWYEENLFEFNNEKVSYVLDKLNNTLLKINSHEMLDNYLAGPAWLAIIGGTNMVPMYYYSPSQQGIYEKGLASDNPYSLNWSLSVGRLIGWNIQDVSSLIARTFFYQQICGEPHDDKDWHNKFNFIFGEGFGETGGIFHQIPYSREIKDYGFYPTVFGDLRNSRQMAFLYKTYIGSNYIEYLGHGDWFWFTPTMYGLDIYSKAIDVAHAKNWKYDKPSVFLTSACLMGRIDGISPYTNIGLTMLHAGCNSFIGATRTTGSEAGLSILENHLIIDDYSIGEALRGEKLIDKEPPNYYVRVLFGDPAFNPYEPYNGFSNQGRPLI